MKKSILLLALISTIYSSAQENFTIENNFLTWTKEYPANLTKEQISEKLVRNPALRDLETRLRGYSDYIPKFCPDITDLNMIMCDTNTLIK